MALTVKQLGQARLTAVAQVLYTCPLDKPSIVKGITITGARSVADSAYPVSVYIVPPGGVPGDDNVLFKNISVERDGFFDWSGLHAMPLGGTLQALGEGNTITVSGAELGTPV